MPPGTTCILWYYLANCFGIVIMILKTKTVKIGGKHVNHRDETICFKDVCTFAFTYEKSEETIVA